MHTISLAPFTHNAKSCIAIKFKFDFKLKECIKNITGVYWTQTHRTFYIHNEDGTLQNLKADLKKEGIRFVKETEPTIIKPFNKKLS